MGYHNTICIGAVWMKPTIRSIIMIQPTYNDFEMATEELARIHNAHSVQGEQSSAVQIDMKQWALKAGLWPTAEYSEIVEAHAEARGWKQENFTGMETL